MKISFSHTRHAWGVNVIHVLLACSHRRYLRASCRCIGMTNQFSRWHERESIPRASTNDQCTRSLLSVGRWWMKYPVNYRLDNDCDNHVGRRRMANRRGESWTLSFDDYHPRYGGERVNRPMFHLALVHYHRLQLDKKETELKSSSPYLSSCARVCVCVRNKRAQVGLLIMIIFWAMLVRARACFDTANSLQINIIVQA